MKKIHKVRFINTIIYGLFLGYVAFLAFFYEVNSYADGRGKGFGVGILLVLLYLLITMPFHFYKKTKSVPETITMIKEVFVDIISLPLYDLLLKKWKSWRRKLKRNKAKKRK